MTFEEDFPSLKYPLYAEEVAVQYDGCSDKFFTEGAIKTHCLDKERVKQAIIKASYHGDCYGECEPKAGCQLYTDELLEELGL